MHIPTLSTKIRDRMLDRCSIKSDRGALNLRSGPGTRYDVEMLTYIRRFGESCKVLEPVHLLVQNNEG
jgi:uncharacterized protein YgiM (DUF1202 family)